MPAVLLVPLITEALRFANNILEGTPVEVRKAQAIAWFNISKPLWFWMLKDEQRQVVDQIVAEVSK